MDANERLGIETLKQMRNTGSIEVRLRADMQVDVHARRLDPVNIADVQKCHPSAGLQHDPFEIAGSIVDPEALLQQAGDAQPEVVRALRSNHLTDALERRLESLVAVRFQEVVERMRLER